MKTLKIALLISLFPLLSYGQNNFPGTSMAAPSPVNEIVTGVNVTWVDGTLTTHDYKTCAEAYDAIEQPNSQGFRIDHCEPCANGVRIKWVRDFSVKEEDKSDD